MGVHSPWLDIHRSDDPTTVPVIEDSDDNETER
jgi:hypothetical protein